MDYLATSTIFQTSSDFFDLIFHVLTIRSSYAMHLMDMFLMIIFPFASFFLLSQAYPLIYLSTALLGWESAMGKFQSGPQWVTLTRLE